KCRTLPFRTLHQQLALLHFHHVLADRQSQTRTAELTRDGRIGLFEGFEYRPDAFLADPDPRITDHDLDEYRVLVAFPDPGGDIDMPFLGKLQGIAQD